MKVGNIVTYIYSIIPVIRILTFSIGSSQQKISEKSKITNLISLQIGVISYSTVNSQLAYILCCQYFIWIIHFPPKE